MRGDLCSLEKALLDSSWLLSSFHRFIDPSMLTGWLAGCLAAGCWLKDDERGSKDTLDAQERSAVFFFNCRFNNYNTSWSKLELETVWIIMPLVKVYHLNWKRSFDLIVATVVLSYLGIFVQITFMSARFLIDFLLGTILEGLRFECPLFFDNAMFAGSFVFGVLFPQPFLRTRLLHFSLTKFTLEGSHTAASKG